MGWLLLAAGLYGLWCALLYFTQERLIFPRHFAGPATPGLPREPFIESWWIEPVPGQRVEAWFVRAPAGDERRGAPTPLTLFFHGNGELIEHSLDLAAMYRSWGFHVLVVEYRGYGRSGGKPGQRAIVADARTFLDRALARDDVDADRVIYHGRSLGAGVACALLATRKPAALVIESAFASVPAMARRYLVPTLLVRHPFRNDRALADFDCPVLIMHGRRDGIVPVSHGRRLHEIASRSVYVEVNAGHNDFPPDWRGYERKIRDFLSRENVVPGAYRE